jgi:hypothetical protein
MEKIMNQIPESIMKHHDPNDDPFAALADDSTNQLTSPLEYGSGISYLVAKETNVTTEESPMSPKKEEDHKEEHTESSTGEDVDDDDDDVVKGDISSKEKEVQDVKKES